jgi:hypothetical protein
MLETFVSKFIYYIFIKTLDEIKKIIPRIIQTAFKKIIFLLKMCFHQIYNDKNDMG